MVDTFSRETFEAALPTHKTTGQPLWQSLGLSQGEFCYLVMVTLHAAILIRSSVKEDEMSAGAGKDSIRVWLVDPTTKSPVGAKISNYITRTNAVRCTGWPSSYTPAPAAVPSKS
jgi:hypothetical protein